MSLLPNSSLWSVHLDSFLIPGGKFLYLSDHQGHRRLTQAQAEKRRADAEAQARQAEQRRADAEARRAAALAEKLRSLGIDPDQL